MIGAATGAASGFWAVDPDVPKPSKNGDAGKMSPDGTSAWTKLKAEHGGHGPTIEVTTPSGGCHVYFKCDPSRHLGNREGGLSGLGINVRGDGGYVIMPPSCRWPDGKPYEANQPFAAAAIAAAPQWLYELVSPRRKRPVQDGGTVTFPCTPENVRKVRGALVYVPADPREMWLKMGGALKSLEPEWGDIPRELWDEYSLKEPGSFDAEDQDKTWQGLDPARPGGATVATIFFEAKARGWKPPKEYLAVPSEDALALDFAERHGDELRYVALWSKWIVWAGVYWKTETTLAVFDMARTIMRETAQWFKEHGQPPPSHLAKAKTVSAIESLARSDRRLAAPVEQWDANHLLLNTTEGSAGLSNGVIMPNNRMDYCMKAAGTYSAPPGTRCPLWLAFLDTAMNGDQDLIAYLQRVCGYCLTGLIKEHALFFLYGTGGNGKGVFINTLRGIFGTLPHDCADRDFHRYALDRAPD